MGPSKPLKLNSFHFSLSLTTKIITIAIREQKFLTRESVNWVILSCLFLYCMLFLFFMVGFFFYPTFS